MAYFNEIIFVTFTPEQMFELVNDIEQYPKFLPWVKKLEIISKDNEAHQKTATMDIGKDPFNESFTTSVHAKENQIDVKYVNGPFEKLSNKWVFTKYNKSGIDGCLIEFTLDFSFKNNFYDRLLTPVIKKIFFKLANSFIERAKDIYGIQGFKSLTMKSDYKK